MVKMAVVYEGDLHCELTHLPSGSKIETDAPKDNMGRGERFSPTDLMGAALASCIVTTMGIVAKRDGVEFSGARAEVVKQMITQPPRRIGSLPVKVILSSAIPVEYRKKLENAALHCPVKLSLNPEIETSIDFEYQ